MAVLHHKLSVSLTNALDHFEHIRSIFQGKRVCLFLDYDGTLTPIVKDPTRATLPSRMKQQLTLLHQYFVTGVISGRSIFKLQQFIDIDGLFYAGSHGFDILGPNGASIRNQVAVDIIPTLKTIKEALNDRLRHIEGAYLEDNEYAVSVHYRNVDPTHVPEIDQIVNESIAEYPFIRRGYGKKVFELKPNIEWNKGKALLWVLNALGLDKDDVFSIYIGDDVTDEDAFAVFLSEDCPLGVGLKVTEESTSTKASFTLKDPDEVSQFLDLLLEYGKSVGASPQLECLDIKQDAI